MGNRTARYQEYLRSHEGAASFLWFRDAIYGLSDSLIRVLSYCREQWMPCGQSVRVADLGCGDGRRGHVIASMLRTAGHSVAMEYVDPSSVLLNRMVHSDDCGDGELVMKSDVAHAALGRYDLVLLIHSIYGMSIEEVHRVAKCVTLGGRILAVVNSPRGLLGTVKRIIDHDNRRTEGIEFARVLAAAGMTICGTSYATRWFVANHELNVFIDCLIEWLALGESLGAAVQRECREAINRFGTRTREGMWFTEAEDVFAAIRVAAIDGEATFDVKCSTIHEYAIV